MRSKKNMMRFSDDDDLALFSHLLSFLLIFFTSLYPIGTVALLGNYIIILLAASFTHYCFVLTKGEEKDVFHLAFTL